MILTHLVLFSFLGGASVTDAPEPPAPPEAVSSGGWPLPEPRFESQRRAKTAAELAKRRIIEESAAAEASGKAIARGGATLPLPGTAALEAAALDAALAEALARLHTSAYLDAEIARHFRRMERLEDEDDAEALLLAIAVLH